MICQRIETRARSTLVAIVIVRRLESVITGDYFISMLSLVEQSFTYRQREFSMNSPGVACSSYS